MDVAAIDGTRGSRRSETWRRLTGRWRRRNERGGDRGGVGSAGMEAAAVDGPANRVALNMAAADGPLAAPEWTRRRQNEPGGVRMNPAASE